MALVARAYDRRVHGSVEHLARATANALNADAGSHAVTADPLELAAIERAAERSWAASPYIEQRYGERGRRFTRSDSGWIATLPDLPQDAVDRQLRWLGVLLASRGMPRLLLEEHLEVLAEELAVALPDRAAAYEKLRVGAAGLRRERESHLPAAQLEQLAGTFRQRLPPHLPDEIREGVLIGAAVADERAGIAQAVDSLLAWLADPAHFPARWCTAVDLVLRQARDLPGDA